MTNHPKSDTEVMEEYLNSDQSQPPPPPKNGHSYIIERPIILRRGPRKMNRLTSTGLRSSSAHLRSL